MSENLRQRTFEGSLFDRAYDEVVLGNDMFEESDYYRRYRGRYRRTIEYLCKLSLPGKARILEIGGGQIALLMQRMFGDECTVGDVSARHATSIKKFGLEHVVCDLVHDDLPYRDHFDAFVLCEVIEHLPMPPHLVFERVARWIRPGGHLFLTTPNLYRLRNVLRLAVGREVFCNFFVPERGQSLGHFIEYSAEQIRWQLERAGLSVTYVDRVQLTNAGTELVARLFRPILAPLLWMRPSWRDNLVACASKPQVAAN